LNADSTGQIDRVASHAFAGAQLGRLRYSLLVLGVACQIATVWITWPLWQTRSIVPHLATFDVPQFSFGWLMLGSAALVALRPSWGIVIHWIVLGVACLFDQFRLQPQFFAIAILMTACVWEWSRRAARWFLASTLFWAGLHKSLSSDWLGHSSHWLLARTPVDADEWFLMFAIVVAVSEVALGVAACVRPRWAAVGFVPMHLGIIVFLLLIDWNQSVIPWNLTMAIIGGWVLWRAAESWRPTSVWETLVCVIWMVAPVGFYAGWIDHGFAGVLYSDLLPRGQITTHAGVHKIVGWGELNVPFPSERRTLRMYFQQYGQPGDKLHIADPRRLLDDQFFVLDADRRPQPIDVDTFFLPQENIPGRQPNALPAVAGIAVDQRRAIFELRRAGVRMLRESPNHPIYAIAFPPETFDDSLLSHVSGLPNVTQVQLANTSVTNRDLRHLLCLRLLTGIGLDGTGITDNGLKQLAELPFLQYIECENTSITEEGLALVLKTPLAHERPAADSETVPEE
jgi:hypothetical protein